MFCCVKLCLINNEQLFLSKKLNLTLFNICGRWSLSRQTFFFRRRSKSIFVNVHVDVHASHRTELVPAYLANVIAALHFHVWEGKAISLGFLLKQILPDKKLFLLLRMNNESRCWFVCLQNTNGKLLQTNRLRYF